MTHITHKKELEHTDNLLRRAGYIYSQKLFKSLSDSNQQWKFFETKTKHGYENSEISRVRPVQDFLKDKIKIADTINSYFSNLGLNEGGTEKDEPRDYALDKPVFYQRTVYFTWSITTKQSNGSRVTYYMVLQV